MRCFIAIDIDRNIRTQIERLGHELRQKTHLAKPDVKWVNPDLIHLTLKFLGEVRDRELPEICQIVTNVADVYKPFSIDVENIGSFGSPMRVLWVGIGPNETLEALQKDLDKQLQRVGFAGDRKKFTGHLTLCRVKRSKAGKKLYEYIKDYENFKLGTVSINSVCIYKSELTKTGPEYTLISKSMLQQ